MYVRTWGQRTDNPSPIRVSQNIRIFVTSIFAHARQFDAAREGGKNHWRINHRNEQFSPRRKKIIPPTLRIPYGKFTRKTTAAKFALIRNVNCQPPISRP